MSLTLEEYDKARKREWRLRNKDRIRLYNKRDREKNRERIRAKSQRWYRKWIIRRKVEAFEHYGGIKCKRCGIKDIDVLTLDHINEDGAQHRKTFGRSRLYTLLKQKGYPKGYQVLCSNCNIKKYRVYMRRSRALVEML